MSGWRTKKLSDVLEVQNGYAFDSKAFSLSKGMPLIRIRDLKGGMKTETRFSGDYDKKYVVNAGDLLIGMDGEFGCYEWKGSPALLNQRVCRLQGFTSDLLQRFLFYGVNSHLKAIEDVTGYATVKHLSSKQILDIDFPFPPLPEQNRIVAILDEVFAGIAAAVANTEKNLANARELFESHLNAFFTRKGEGWVEKKLGQVSENLDSKRVPITKNKRAKGQIPYYGASGIVDYVADYIFNEELLLVSEDGANLLARTYPIAFSVEGKAWVNNHAHVLRFQKRAYQKFIEYYLNSIPLEPYVSGMAQPKLNQKSLHSITVPWHNDINEVALVVDQVTAIETKTQRLESIYRQKLDSLAELKQSILQKAFSGELTANPDKILNEVCL